MAERERKRKTKPVRKPLKFGMSMIHVGGPLFGRRRRHPNDVEFRVVLERDPKTRTWVAEAPGVAGAYTQGSTQAQALARLREVFELLRETDGIPSQPTVEFTTLRVEA